MSECYKHERQRVQGSPCPYCQLNQLREAAFELIKSWETEWVELALNPQRAPQQLRQLLTGESHAETSWDGI